VLEFVAVEVGEGSSLGCSRCGTLPPHTYHPTDEVTARIRSTVDAPTSAPGPNIVLTGPEPFGHPALPDLVAACAEAGFERIGIETEGGALAVPGHAAGALGAGVAHLYVRVLATDEELADGLSGRPGLGHAVAAGIPAYLAAAEQAGITVCVTVVVPLCRHNLDSLPATVAALSSWGVHAVRLEAAGQLSSGASVVIAAACDTGMVNRLWVETDPALDLPASHLGHRVAGRVVRGD
jgi:molybdenum cofactor biosynthesis enzyme MoaA